MTMKKSIKTYLSSEIADILRKKIFEGMLKPDDRLTELKLANELGVSRGPIRDAIKQLENEGFVSTPPNGRTVVIGFTEQDIEDYHEVRLYLESQAIKKVIKKSYNDKNYDEWLKKLEKKLMMIKKYLDLNEDIVNEYDYSFHEDIIRKAGNKIILRIWNSLAGTRKSIMEINMDNEYLSKLNILRPDRFYEYHEGLYIGLDKRDAEIAINSLKEHLDEGTKTYKLTLKKAGQ